MEKTAVIISNCHLQDLSTKQEIRIIGETIFGRTEGQKTFPSDTKMSRKHFRLVLTEDVVLIEDLGSTNLTQVNGKQLRPNVLYKLRSRDLISAGKQKFQIFVDGKIVPAASSTQATITDPQGTAVIERFIAAPEETTRARMGKPGNISGEIVDFSKEAPSDNEDDNDAEIVKLAKDTKVSWFLQFEGSEFGPITFTEMERVVKHQHFQGGLLYVWAQGLSNWTPISPEHIVFNQVEEEEEKAEPEQPPVAEIERGCALVATVNCLVEEDGLKRRLAATCEEISPFRIRIFCKEVMPDKDLPFHIEVVPLKSSGLPKFVAKVQQQGGNGKKNVYTLEFLAVAEADLAKIKKYVNTH